jgi:hypothetical protein
MNYEPGAPSVKFFFFKRLKRCSPYGRIFEVNFALNSRGLGDFGSPSGREESIENCCENNIQGLSSVSKHDPTLPVKGQFYGVEGAATV